MTYEDAVVGRWVARIFGSLLVLLFLVFFFGEGTPQPWTWPWAWTWTARGTFIFLGFGLMIAGLVIAWFWEGLGGLLAVAGYIVHVAGVPDSALSPLALVAVTGITHVLCWLRIRSGAKGPSAL
jgi:hypothetical protein